MLFCSSTYGKINGTILEILILIEDKYRRRNIVTHVPGQFSKLKMSHLTWNAANYFPLKILQGDFKLNKPEKDSLEKENLVCNLYLDFIITIRII